MSEPKTIVCRKCKSPIQWEQIQGMRLERVHTTIRKGGYRLRPYFRTKCDCGDSIKRNGDGRRLRF